MTSSLRKVVCMFRIKFPTKRIFRIFPILRTDGMAPFGTYLWNDPRMLILCDIIIMSDINDLFLLAAFVEEFSLVSESASSDTIYTMNQKLLSLRTQDDTETTVPIYTG